jgi:glucose uptake protein
MFFPQSYTLAVSLCFITMICWGSWANTQKLATKEWPFQLFYWDYTLGILILALVLGLTLGSSGELGRSFVVDLSQEISNPMLLALAGGVVFNIANLLLVAAIDFAGMAVAFPVGIGLALVLGVLVNYVANPVGNAIPLMTGGTLVTLAIVFDAKAYQKVQTNDPAGVKKGLVIALAAGFLMSFFFYLVAASLVTDFSNPEAGKLSPYSGVFIFSLGILLSNFLWNTIFHVQISSGT